MKQSLQPCRMGMSSPTSWLQAVDSTDFEVIFTISGSLPSGTQQVNRGVPEPEDLRCEGKWGSFWEELERHNKKCVFSLGLIASMACVFFFTGMSLKDLGNSSKFCFHHTALAVGCLGISLELISIQ